MRVDIRIFVCVYCWLDWSVLKFVLILVLFFYER